jgi:hypothetical protein
MQMGASYACGAGTGQSALYLLLLSYISGPRVGVTVELEGCATEKPQNETRGVPEHPQLREDGRSFVAEHGLYARSWALR